MTSSVLLDERYELGDEIGRGGMGDVYRARDLRLGRNVAVKFLRDAPTADPRRFEAEWRTLASFSHPHLVRLYDAGESEGRAFIVMELIEGETLAAALLRGPLPSDHVARVGDAVARALAYAHGKGVIHRDVKPSNILIGEDDGVWLADFGVARLLDTTGLTATGHAIGTPAYLAPEQVEGSAVGPPADVYALGLVLYEALTGKRSFEGTPAEMAAARLYRGPQLDDLAPEWRGLIGEMTARDATDRPQAALVSARLDAELRGGGATLPAGAPADEAATAVLAPTALLGAETLPLGGDTVAYSSLREEAAPRQPVGLRRAAVVGVLLLVGIGVLLASLLGGGGNPQAAVGASGATTTTGAPTTTAPSTTTSAPTTTVPVASTTPVSSAADAVLAAVQAGMANGSIGSDAGKGLLNALNPLLSGANPQAEAAAYQQLLSRAAAGVQSGAIGGTAGGSLAIALGQLGGALGQTATTTTTTPPPPPPPPHHGHGHGPGGDH
ncbi:MAG TPA: serine/threonine-protein kinase [Acidimicrobiales bacterium]|nr:serine/threonine-protein kinase [Acidimicrobiales bacterium]